MSAADPRASHDGGFTLTELLLVLSIVGLLLSSGLPSFRSYLQAQQLVSTANQFLFALNLARSEAMRRGSRVDLAARDGRNWQSGWIVFTRSQGGSNQHFTSSDELIHGNAGLPAGLQVSARLSDRSAAYIAYNASGRTRTHASALARQWGSWQFSLGSHTRLLRITLAGRARLCNPADDHSCRFSELTETENTMPTESP